MNKLRLFSIMLLSCFAMACSEPPKAASPPVPKVVAEPLPTIDWQDYNGGLVFDKAEKTSNLLFLVFYSENCGACHMYARLALTDKCVIKESKNGYTFSKVDIGTDEGLEAYVLHSDVEPDENGSVRVAVPTTMIFATIKEVPNFDMRIINAEGVITPNSLCDAMKKLRQAHQEAIKNVLEEFKHQP